MRERLRPAPEPPLKIRPSSRYQFRIESIVSSTARMKHALTCCGEVVPTLNQTGELNENTWCSSIQVSSCSKISASAVGGEVAVLAAGRGVGEDDAVDELPQARSRASVPTAPRKYLVVTMVEALTDQKSGNSTPRCSKTVSPVFQFGLDDVAALPGDLVVGVHARVVKMRSIVSPSRTTCGFASCVWSKPSPCRSCAVLCPWSVECWSDGAAGVASDLVVRSVR